MRVLSRCTPGLAGVAVVSMTALSLTLGVSRSYAQAQSNCAGVVLDSANDAISNATVEIRRPGLVSRVRTNSEGHFVIPCDKSSTQQTLLVVAAGFAARSITVSGDSREPIEVHLQPAEVLERIVVNSNSDAFSPGTTSHLLTNDIERSGAITLDDVLRQAIGFSLFRRSGSLTANPTSQGVSLRGVGANGASRALVLLDGVPLNNPFGSWVYWNRVPRESIASVSIVNGAASDSYGGGALGGIINIETKQLSQPFFDGEGSWGNMDSPSGSAVAGFLLHNVGVTGAIEGLRTDGYVLVPKEQRGTVDVAAGTADISGSLTISHALQDGGRAFLRLNSFAESRRNGTPLQVNDTRISAADFGFDRPTSIGDLSIRAFGSREIFNQNFSAVSVDRNSESLTNRQRNPSQQIGAVLQWRRQFAERHIASAGIEGRDVRGHSGEITFATSRVTAHVDAGGRQRTFGLFGQDSIIAGKWTLAFGGRFDRWTNSDGFSHRVPVSGPSSFTEFRDTSESAFSPRISLSRRIGSNVWLNISGYRAFRAPTLNELYRNFRVGNVVTNANANLHAERLTGAAADVNFHKFSERLILRGNFFWSRIDDPVANLTLNSTPALITRQRQNLGAIRARGLEATVEFRATNHVNLSAEYLLTDSTVLRFPTNAALEGLLVPQVPRHQFNFQLSFQQKGWTAALQGRFVGVQYDDDQNLLPLARFFTLDAEASRRLSKSVDLFVAVQNATNTRYQVARTPVVNLGPPVLARVGLRVHIRD